MARISPQDAITLAAFIRSDIDAIARIEKRVAQFDLHDLTEAELDSVGYSLHNIFNALENCFKRISDRFGDPVNETGRWHRDLLDAMFMDIMPIRQAVLPEDVHSILVELLGFRHVFRHAYDIQLDQAKIISLWSRWLLHNNAVSQSLASFATDLETLAY